MGGEAVDHGYKGKGTTVHLATDAKGQPLGREIRSAKGDERKQVAKLIDQLHPLFPKELLILEAETIKAISQGSDDLSFGEKVREAGSCLAHQVIDGGYRLSKSFPTALSRSQ